MERTIILITCAWLMWSHTQPLKGEPSYSLAGGQAAFDTRTQCEAAARPWNTMMEEAVRKLMQSGELPQFTISYQCLPDSIDPRK